MSKHAFPKHRYSHGKQVKGINLDTFKRMVDKVDKIDLGSYTPLLFKSLLALLFWCGIRKTEAHGSRAHRYVLKPCKRHLEPIIKVSEPMLGITREDITEDNEWLYVHAVTRKHGSREKETPLPLWKALPFVNLIREQWLKTEPKQRVFPISEWDSWNIMKQIDAKKYLHFFRFNRITELCSNPKMSIANICSWVGLSPQTINSYMERSGRFTRETAEKMREQYAYASLEVKP